MQSWRWCVRDALYTCICLCLRVNPFTSSSHGFYPCKLPILLQILLPPPHSPMMITMMMMAMRWRWWWWWRRRRRQGGGGPPKSVDPHWKLRATTTLSNWCFFTGWREAPDVMEIMKLWKLWKLWILWILWSTTVLSLLSNWMTFVIVLNLLTF